MYKFYIFENEINTFVRAILRVSIGAAKNASRKMTYTHARTKYSVG